MTPEKWKEVRQALKQEFGAVNVPTTREVIARIDLAFRPDLRVRIDDQGIVTGFTPTSQAGANFLLAHACAILGADYDQALRLAAGLTFEVTE